jgi:predicted RNA binding protein YcfA (HicA-like mRNA interferase family)
MIKFSDFKSIMEEKISGHNMKRLERYLNTNGFYFHSHGNHPKYKHEKTGSIITGMNKHDKINDKTVGRIVTAVKQHNNQNSLDYTPIDSQTLRK